MTHARISATGGTKLNPSWRNRLCYAGTEMRRAIHIAVALVTVLLLVRPFDCFAGTMTPQAADCCAKGKCHPGRNADECCRNMTPTSTQLSVLGPSHHHAVPVPDFTVATELIVVPQRIVSLQAGAGLSSSPPGSPPGTHRNLPLLI